MSDELSPVNVKPSKDSHGDTVKGSGVGVMTWEPNDSKKKRKDKGEDSQESDDDTEKPKEKKANGKKHDSDSEKPKKKKKKTKEPKEESEEEESEEEKKPKKKKRDDETEEKMKRLKEPVKPARVVVGDDDSPFPFDMVNTGYKKPLPVSEQPKCKFAAYALQIASPFFSGILDKTATNTTVWWIVLPEPAKKGERTVPRNQRADKVSQFFTQISRNTYLNRAVKKINMAKVDNLDMLNVKTGKDEVAHDLATAWARKANGTVLGPDVFMPGYDKRPLPPWVIFPDTGNFAKRTGFPSCMQNLYREVDLTALETKSKDPKDIPFVSLTPFLFNASRYINDEGDVHDGLFDTLEAERAMWQQHKDENKKKGKKKGGKKKKDDEEEEETEEEDKKKKPKKKTKKASKKESKKTSKKAKKKDSDKEKSAEKESKKTKKKKHKEDKPKEEEEEEESEEEEKPKKKKKKTEKVEKAASEDEQDEE